MKEFYSALLNPAMIPGKTMYNIDLECNYDTMFKSPQDQREFSQYFDQTCHLNNNCEMDTENMVVNVTYT